MYPHAATGLFAARRRDVIRRNAALLPAYTLVLGLIALFGYMARAVPAVNEGVKAGHGNAQLSVPLLFSTMFPSWFAGIAYAAVIIGALVPAAVMSIAAANLSARTIYSELFRPYASPPRRPGGAAGLAADEVGALGFALELNKTFSINLQLLGGIGILQTFPSVVIGLYTRWFHRAALIFGWLAGMTYGTVQAYRTSGGGQAHIGGSAAPVFGRTTYGDQETPYCIAVGARPDHGPCGAGGRVTGESAAARPGDGQPRSSRIVVSGIDARSPGWVNFVPLGNRLGGGDRHITWPGRRTARAT